MIIRIVKMSFQPEKLEEFLTLFEERKALIRGFEGCRHLELWQDAREPQVLFTYSLWETEDYLNHYRFSDLFKDTWAKTKVLFSDRPQAWSLDQRENVTIE